MKKPWVAVVLNAIPLVLGLGYLYLGLWQRFLIVFGLQVLIGFVAARGNPSVAMGLTVLWLFSMIDAHKQAKAMSPPGASAAI